MGSRKREAVTPIGIAYPREGCSIERRRVRLRFSQS